VDAPPVDASRKGVVPPPAAASARGGGGTAICCCVGEGGGAVARCCAKEGSGAAVRCFVRNGDTDHAAAMASRLSLVPPPSSMAWGRAGAPSDLFHRAYRMSRAGARRSHDPSFG
jgi:hypothetical protein